MSYDGVMLSQTNFLTIGIYFSNKMYWLSLKIISCDVPLKNFIYEK